MQRFREVFHAAVSTAESYRLAVYRAQRNTHRSQRVPTPQIVYGDIIISRASIGNWLNLLTRRDMLDILRLYLVVLPNVIIAVKGSNQEVLIKPPFAQIRAAIAELLDGDRA